MPDKSERGFVICAFSDLPDPGCKGFLLDEGDWPMHGFVVRRDDHVYGYMNICPHAGRMLNWGPDRFLTKDQSLIMCSAHGASFEIDTGLCVAGPCLGDSLTRLDCGLEDGRVVVYPKK